MAPLRPKALTRILGFIAWRCLVCRSRLELRKLRDYWQTRRWDEYVVRMVARLPERGAHPHLAALGAMHAALKHDCNGPV